jgi:hypothetical protein
MPKPIQSKIFDLLPDINNANNGTDAGKLMLDHSMEELGAGRSVLVDKNGRLISGNKTALAAAEAGIEDVLLVPSDGSKLVVVKRSDLDLFDPADTRARRMALADNRVGQVNLSWDQEVLSVLADSFPETVAGLFEPGEIKALIIDETGEPPETNDRDLAPDEILDDAPPYKVKFTLATQEEKEVFVYALKQHSREYWVKMLVDYISR